MLSRGVRSLLSFQKNYLLKSPLSFSNRVYFSSFGSGNDGDDKPDGFEKFKRKPKKPTEKVVNKSKEEKEEEKIKVEDQQDQEQKNVGVSFRKFGKKKRRVDNTPNEESSKKEVEETQESKPQEKQEDGKAQNENKKKWSFTYTPKNLGKQETQNEDQKDKEKDDQSNDTKKQQEKEKKTNEEGEKKEDESKNNDKKQGEQQQQQQQQNGNKQDQDSFESKFRNFYQKGNNRIYVTIALGIGIFGPLIHYQMEKGEAQSSISYADFFKTYLHNDQVRLIYIERVPDGKNLKTNAKVSLRNFKEKKLVIGNLDHFLQEVEQYQIDQGKSPESFIPISFDYRVDLNKTNDSSFSWITTFIALGIGYIFLRSIRTGSKAGGQDIFGMGKSNVKMFGVDNKVSTRFKDVAGQDEAQQEIKEFVDFLRKPKKYIAIGAKLPKGALLTGPPGTGKTLLAKACAGEAGVPFFFISGSEFVEMFVGVGASRVRDLFKQAKAKSPSIIFIDEIDAVGRKREGKMGGNDEKDNTLNQLLVEMDGFGTDSHVIVLAATNRKELLDPALTRPGRFDRIIDVTLPDIDGRMQIFLVHLKPLSLHPSRTIKEYAKRLATLTPGFSGADIMNLCNEAAILAARKNKKMVESIDFELASERVIAGLEKKRIVSEEDRRIVAVHESGHAVTSWFLEGGHPLLKLTIIPRTKGSLGFAQYLPNENSLETKSELLDRLCTILGGRVAEEEFFNKITTGAYDDLKRAYELCHTLVTKYGMSEKLGYVGYVENEYNKTYSIETNTAIDEEISRLIQEATVRTRLLIKQYRSQIESLSNTLLEKETLDLRQITKLLGDRPFPPKSNYKAYLDLQFQDAEEEAHKKEEEEEANKKDEGQSHKNEEGQSLQNEEGQTHKKEGEENKGEETKKNEETQNEGKDDESKKSGETLKKEEKEKNQEEK